MFIHNVILAIFSGLTCIYTVPIVYNIFSEYGLYDGLCNKIKDAYTETSYGFWVHMFYLSKFYEFVDTWIVIARGRRPITLQVRPSVISPIYLSNRFGKTTVIFAKLRYDQ